MRPFLTCRPALPGDVDAIGAIMQANLDLFPKEEIEQAMRIRSGVVRVAEFNGQVVGFYVAKHPNSRSSMQIQMVVAQPEKAEACPDIVSALIEDMKQIAVSRNAPEITYEVNNENAALMAILEREGFSRTPSLERQPVKQPFSLDVADITRRNRPLA